ncbi:MAG: YiiX/YebB-like N1pC/P60 family cysteine hydrolase [Bacteroidota bacterium]
MGRKSLSFHPSKIKRTVFHQILLLCNPFIRIANKVNWRFGRPYEGTPRSLEPFIGLLQPGMVILSHKKYELTNWFIRGYWTHAAIYINDKYVIEAISKGVVKKELKTFINTVDDFIILKPKFCDQAVMKEAVDFVETIVGYPYNFTFRSRKESFYCSELVYRAYSQTSMWKYVKIDYPEKLWSYHSDKILIPQHILESEPLWQIVCHKS